MTRDRALEDIILGLLPPGVIVRAGPIVAAGPLPTIEARLITRAVETRRAEFASGRVLARNALAALGRPVQALGATPGAGPDWPDGVVGSLTHAHGVVAAAVARKTALAGLGIDIEGPRTLSLSTWGSVFTQAECAALTDSHAAARLFSAKEAAYKCLAGLGQPPAEFSDFEMQPQVWGYRLRMSRGAPPVPEILVRHCLVGERGVCTAYCHASTGQPA
ncbi:4'-phosphopantetheinyl transferase superfamily protein [Salinisphaera sp.]|uniref:4'-phosphopantetheinyl transferase superfamily protein n=1 Tax=Salinisphaera sp. TaxID=1914330 RepID=UPI000C3D6D12|nr:4'-phosphopantetheinyl transferase superfamily protein [Salinisphaera sp.]MAS10150.1 hypothetical protein [Salinisphaera sp.]|tara:strand:- start:7429 stop:8085 length:657 start_codon:yes stop_codon:yes gene_type:complete